MNYILYNPKSNSENNDLNIIPGKEELERRGAKQISLLDVDVREFCSTLTESDRVLICGGDGTLHHFVNNTRGFTFPCPVSVVRSGTGNDFLNDIGQIKPDELFDIREHISALPEVEVDGEKRLFITGVGMGIDGAVCDGVEQYKKAVDIDAFAEFYTACKHPVIYNGDLNSLADINRIGQQFSGLKGIMLGRGLLANPALGVEYHTGHELTDAEQVNLVRQMHDAMMRELAPRLQGNTQFLSKMKPYWEYLLPDMLKRDKKAILKATTIEKYMNAVNDGLAGY